LSSGDPESGPTTCELVLAKVVLTWFILVVIVDLIIDYLTALFIVLSSLGLSLDF
jgi:hypothetical protein